MSSVRHTPIWENDRQSSFYSRLSSNLTVDAAVVGGGITGVTTALLLKKAGLRVALLTDGKLGGGTTGSTTAHLTSIPDVDFKVLQSKFGTDKARLTIESLYSSIHRIQAFTKDMNQDVMYHRVPAFKYTEAPEDIEFLREEHTIAQSLGIDCSLTGPLDLPFRTLEGLRIEEQALFHPLRYLDQLAKQIPGDGSHIFEDTHVEHIEDGTPASLHCGGYRVTAHSIALCTHSPAGVYLSLQTRVAPYMSYVVAFESEEMQTPGLYFDTSEPYFYLRPYTIDNKQVWIVGGCDHKTGQHSDTDQVFANLEDYVRVRFRNPNFLHRWSNELFESVDGLPYIGKIPFSHSLYTGTGFAGVGMTFGTLSAMINSDLILGRDNEYAPIFSPNRIKPLASAARFTSENANVFRWFIGDRMHPSDYKSVDDIERGEGHVLSLGGKKYAIYRDDHGFLHVFSPRCTHMGGIVHWNRAEKTWDCPLHGGRYKCTGEVFEAPPLQDLSPELLEQAQSPGSVLVSDEPPLNGLPLQP